MDNAISQKLDALLRLQSLDSKLDQINRLRGDLPEEVADLEDDIAGYQTRIGKFTADIEGFEQEIAALRGQIKESEKLIKKYEDQQANVRNSREYDAISKEIESQQLDIQIFDKKIREATLRIEKKTEDIASITATLEERSKDLATKKEELDRIIAEGREEEEKIATEREAAAADVDERLLFSYNRIRGNARNGLSVVAVRRNACGGCFNQVPPQRQAEIRERRKIIVCEHCGRILASVDSPEPEMAAAGKAR